MSQKFVFERKLARKSTFLSKGFNFKDSNLVPWMVLSILHPLTAKTSWVTVSYSKYYTSLNVHSGNMFCIKFQVLAFFLVEIQLFSAQKQMSFRRRIFDALRTWRP
jgi:hypothetical protein